MIEKTYNANKPFEESGYEDRATWWADKLMLHGETIPQLNPKNVDNYYISC